MNKFKIAFVILLIVTLAFIGTTAYCYVKAVVYAPEEPKPYFKDGIWHDPSLEEWKAYTKAKNALKPYRIFLQYSPIGFILLSVSWLFLLFVGSLWMKRKEKKKQGDTHKF